MKYLVDGHNLIPKLGWRLDSLDDEMRLVELLQGFCRSARAEVEVYFDRAPAGQARTQRFGSVSAHFVRQGLPADDEIIRRVTKLGKIAPNWCVVTSDHRIQTSARAVRARVLTSEQFVEMIHQARQGAQATGGAQPASLSDAEVEEWIQLFRDKKSKNS